MASLLLLPCLGDSAFAASGAWLASPTNGNWEAAGGNNNWSTGANTFPGTTSIAGTPANADVATFAVNSSTNAVTLAADLNVAGITFGAAATPLNAFTIGTTGGSKLFLTSAGTIQYLADTSAATTQTINAPLVFGGGSSAVTYTIRNDNATATNLLNIGGALSGGTTNTTTLTLAGANAGNNTVSGLISNGSSSSLSISKTSASSVWVLGNSSNSFTGGVQIGGGTLSVANIGNATFASALGTNGTIKIGSLTTGAGILLYTGTTETSDKVINLAATTTGGATIDQSGTGLLKFTSDMTNAGTTKTVTLQGSTAGTGEFAGKIVDGTGATSVNKAGTGTWTLSGVNAFTGGVQISGGVLSVANIGNAGAASALGTSGTIKIGGAGAGLGSTLLYTGVTGETSNKVINLASPSTGDATIDQSGTSGVLKFTSDMTNAGTTKTVTLKGSTAGTGEFAGKIVDGTGATSVTKAGTGAWTLSGSNAYTGTTTVTLGTLLVNGAQTNAGAFSVSSGGTLGGKGTIATASNAGVTFANGAALSPGDGSASNFALTLGTGVFNISAMATSGKLQFTLDTVGASDKLTLTSGTLNIGTLNSSEFAFALGGGFGTGTYTLFDTAGTITSVSLDTVTFALNGSFNGNLQFANSNQDIQLVVSAVPEPATWGLLALSLTFVTVMCRRRS